LQDRLATKLFLDADQPDHAYSVRRAASGVRGAGLRFFEIASPLTP